MEIFLAVIVLIQTIIMGAGIKVFINIANAITSLNNAIVTVNQSLNDVRNRIHENNNVVQQLLLGLVNSKLLNNEDKKE